MNNPQYPAIPVAAVGAVIIHAGRVLLVKRARPPRRGRWALPGGSVKLGETLRQAVEREVGEETGVTVAARRPVHCFDIISRDTHGQVQFHYVIVDWVADYITGEAHPGDDASHAGWFEPAMLASMDIDKDTLTLLRRWDEFAVGT